MKRTTISTISTIFIDDGRERELRLVAHRRGHSVAAVALDAIAREIAAEKHPRLSFIGVGVSGRRDIAERHEEFLWKTLDRHARKAPVKPGPAPRRSPRRGRVAGKKHR